MERIEQPQLQESLPGMPLTRPRLSHPECHHQSCRWDLGTELACTSPVHQHWGISCLPFFLSLQWVVIHDALLRGFHSVSSPFGGKCSFPSKRAAKAVTWRDGQTWLNVAKRLQSWNGNKYLQLFLQSSLVLIKWTGLIKECLLRLWWLSHWCNKQRETLSFPAWKVLSCSFVAWVAGLDTIWAGPQLWASCCFKSLQRTKSVLLECLLICSQS